MEYEIAYIPRFKKIATKLVIPPIARSTPPMPPPMNPIITSTIAQTNSFMRLAKKKAATPSII
jgi:hypothetical protein